MLLLSSRRLLRKQRNIFNFHLPQIINYEKNKSKLGLLPDNFGRTKGTNQEKIKAMDSSHPVEETKKESKFEKLRAAVDKDLLEKWDQEQKFLRTKLIEADDFPWSLKDRNLSYIGGVDLSFAKNNPNLACSYLVVMAYPSMKVVYKDHELVHLDLPYVPGFLAFREVSHLLKLVDKLKATKPQYIPQVILVDGNGILHQNGFGLASHLGVLTDIPTIGCGKTVFYVDGISSDKVRKLCDENLHKGGDFVKLEGDSKKVWGAALLSTDQNKDPLIVSVGHKISLDTALEVVKTCCKFRVPEPVRHADQKSRIIVKDATNKGVSDGVKNEMVFKRGKKKKDEDDEDEGDEGENGENNS